MTLEAELVNQHAALTSGAGYAVLDGRSQVRLTGNDRLRFLHGLCTNDIQSLTAGEGCEAFLTTVQGKAAGYTYVFCETDCLVVDTEPGLAEGIVASFDRFIIREDVELHDDTATKSVVLIAGRAAASRLAERLGAPLPEQPMRHVQVTLDELEATVRSVPYAGAGSLFLVCATDQLDQWTKQLDDLNFTRCNSAVVEIVRIESGTPVYGVDVSAENLPQEIHRDDQAINFNKGCYLGQETIARLDAMGHVNRLLVGLRFDGSDVPPSGTVIKVNDKPAARITSACWSPSLDSALALAFVRREFFAAGTRLSTEFGEAEVVALPAT